MKSFFIIFYLYSSTIPGVLVGHYTQLVWGPTSRIGCGKIVHKPKSGPNKWGSQIFVCDYGIGGRFRQAISPSEGDSVVTLARPGDKMA